MSQYTEQEIAKARELYAIEHDRDAMTYVAEQIRAGRLVGGAEERAIRAIVAALREGQKAGGAEDVCGQAYQVVGVLLSDTGQFDTPHGEKILDNLSQARVVHEDVLPWASVEKAGGQEAAMFGQIIEADFSRNTLTLEMEPGYRAFAGRVMISAAGAAGGEHG